MSETDIAGQPGSTEAPGAAPPPDLAGALLRYRIFAYIVGTGLVVLVLVGIPMQIWADNDVIVNYVGFAHGWLFIIYLIFAVILGYKAKWPLGRIALIMAAGTIPFLSFYAERRATRWVRAQQAAAGISTR